MDEELAKQVRGLLDRQAISDCIVRYARGTDRNDVELAASAYHPDAIDDHGVYVGAGRDLAQWAYASHKQCINDQHHLTTQSVEVDGDTAHAETYWLSTRRFSNDKVTLASGRYLDRLERRDGEWRIAARICMVGAYGSLVLEDMAKFDSLFTAGAPDSSDLSYERPLAVRRPLTKSPEKRDY